MWFVELKNLGEAPWAKEHPEHGTGMFSWGRKRKGLSRMKGDFSPNPCTLCGCVLPGRQRATWPGDINHSVL